MTALLSQQQYCRHPERREGPFFGVPTPLRMFGKSSFLPPR